MSWCMGWMNVGLGTSYGTSHWFFGAVGNGGMIINSYYMSGWWFEPLRKNINQLGWLFPIYEKIKKCSKPPTRFILKYFDLKNRSYNFYTLWHKGLKVYDFLMEPMVDPQSIHEYPWVATHWDRSSPSCGLATSTSLIRINRISMRLLYYPHTSRFTFCFDIFFDMVLPWSNHHWSPWRWQQHMG